MNLLLCSSRRPFSLLNMKLRSDSGRNKLLRNEVTNDTLAPLFYSLSVLFCSLETFEMVHHFRSISIRILIYSENPLLDSNPSFFLSLEYNSFKVASFDTRIGCIFTLDFMCYHSSVRLSYVVSGDVTLDAHQL